MKIFSRLIHRILNKDADIRTRKAEKNILLSFIVKGISIVSNFLLVPLLINQLNTEIYGVWITLTSFIGWFSFFDVGLGNGLKNTMTESLANNNLEKTKQTISTAYISITSIAVVLIILFLLFNRFLDWGVILNAPESINNELNVLIYYVVISFFVQFVLKLISSIYDAMQMPAVSGLLTALSNIINIFIVLFIIKVFNSDSILTYGIVLSLSPIVVLLIATLFFFNVKYNHLKPSLSYFDKGIVKHLLTLGGKFFLIQISAIMLYQTNNFVIAHVVGSAGVTTYDVVYKYAGITSMIFNIMLSPMWVASGDAYIRNDISWIWNSLSRLNKVIIILGIVGVFQLFLSKYLYVMWIGQDLKISYFTTALMLYYFIISMIGGNYCMVLNGIGKIKLQFILNTLEAIIHIPLSIFLGRIFGINGVLLSMCFVVTANAIWMPYQCKAILRGNAKGVLNQ